MVPNASSMANCYIKFLTLDENVPYCSASNWLEWNCAGVQPMDTIERTRAVCCSHQESIDACLKECNMAPGYEKDSTLAHLVCPFPGFTFTTTTKEQITTSMTTTLPSTTTTEPITTTSTASPPTLRAAAALGRVALKMVIFQKS